MTCFSYHMIYARTILICFILPWGILPLRSDWSLSCDHGLDYASCCEKTAMVRFGSIRFGSVRFATVRYGTDLLDHLCENEVSPSTTHSYRGILTHSRDPLPVRL